MERTRGSDGSKEAAAGEYLESRCRCLEGRGGREDSSSMVVVLPAMIRVDVRSRQTCSIGRIIGSLVLAPEEQAILSCLAQPGSCTQAGTTTRQREENRNAVVVRAQRPQTVIATLKQQTRPGGGVSEGAGWMAADGLLVVHGRCRRSSRWMIDFPRVS